MSEAVGYDRPSVGALPRDPRSSSRRVFAERVQLCASGDLVDATTWCGRPL